MAKKKKGIGASFRQQVEQVPVVQQKAPRTISTNVSTGGSGLGASLRSATKTATQKAEEERSARMRQGLSKTFSSVVRASFNNQRNVQPVTVKKGLYSNLRNQLAPVKHNANYTRSQQSEYLNTELQRKGLNTPMSQLMAGKTNVGVEQGKVLRAGMPTNSNVIESWRRTASDAEKKAREKYGYAEDFNRKQIDERLDNSGKREVFDPSNGKITTALPAKFNAVAPNEVTYKAGDALRGMRWDDVRSGFADAFARKNVEDTAERQFGRTVDDDTLARLEEQRSTLGYGTGMAAGQMAQYALTRGLLSGAGLVGRGAKAADTAGKAFRAEMAIDQASSVPLNIIDAMKEDNLEGIIKRFGINQGLDLVFGAFTEGISIKRNPLYQNAETKHIAAKEARQAGDNAAANALDQSARRDLGAISNAELDEARNDIVARVGQQRRIVNDANVDAIQNANGISASTLNGADALDNIDNRAVRSIENMGYESDIPAQSVSQPSESIAPRRFTPQSAEQSARIQNALSTIDQYGGLDRMLRTADDTDRLIRTFQDPAFDDVDMLEGVANNLFPEGKMRSIRIDAERAYSDDIRAFDADPESFDFIQPVREDYYIDLLSKEVVDELQRSRNVRDIIPQLADDLGVSEDELLDALRRTEGEFYGYAPSEGIRNARTVVENAPAQNFDAIADARDVYQNAVKYYDDLIADLEARGDISNETLQWLRARRNATDKARLKAGKNLKSADEYVDRFAKDIDYVRDRIYKTDGYDIFERHSVGKANEEIRNALSEMSERLTPINGRRQPAKMVTKESANVVPNEPMVRTPNRQIREGDVSSSLLRNLGYDGVDEVAGSANNVARAIPAENTARKAAETAEVLKAKQQVEKPKRITTRSELKAERLKPNHKEIEQKYDDLIKKVEDDFYDVDYLEKYVKDNNLYVDNNAMKPRKDRLKSSVIVNLKRKQDDDVLIPLKDRTTESLEREEWFLANDNYAAYSDSDQFRLGKVRDELRKRESNAKAAKTEPKAERNGAKETVEQVSQESKKRNQVKGVLGEEKPKAEEPNVKAEEQKTKADEPKAEEPKEDNRTWQEHAREDYKTGKQRAEGVKNGKIPSRENGEVVNAIKRLKETKDFADIKDVLDRGVKDGLYNRKIKHLDEGIDNAIKEIEEDPEKVINEILEYHPNGAKANDVPADAVPWVMKGYALCKWADQNGMKALKEDIAATMAKAQSTGGSILRAGQVFTVMADSKTQRDLVADFVEKMQTKYAKRLGDHKLTVPEDLLKKLDDATTEAEKSKILDDISVHVWNQVPQSFFDAISGLRIISMLANTTTMIRNVASNVAFAGVREVDKTINTVMEATAEKLGKIDREHRSHTIYNHFSKENRKIQAFWYNDYSKNNNVIKGQSRWNEGGGALNVDIRHENARHYGVKAGGGKKGGLIGGASSGIEAVRKATSFLMDKGDEIFLAPAYADAATQMMVVRGWSIDDLTPTRIQEIRDYATEVAQKATYRDPSDAAMALAKWGHWQKGDGGFRLLRAVLVGGLQPFKKTPINIGKRSLEYSPLGFAKGVFDIGKAVHAGDSKAVNKAITELSKGTTGTGLVVAGYLLAQQGLVNAKLPTDDEGYLRKDLGEQDYALTLNGKSRTLQWAAPGAVPILAGATLYDQIRQRGWNSLVHPAALVSVLSKSADPLLEMSFMQSYMDIADVTDDVKDVDKILVGVEQIGLSYAAQFIPTILGKVANMVDPVRRDTSSQATDPYEKALERFINKSVINKIPNVGKAFGKEWGSASLPAYIDYKGDEQKTEDIKDRIIENFISPWYTKDIKNDPVAKEVINVNKASDENILLSSSMGNGKHELKLDGKTINLDSHEMEQYKRLKGKANYNNVKKLMNSAEYKSMEMSEKGKAIKQEEDAAKLEAKQKTLLKMGKDEWKVYTDDFSGRKTEYQDAKDADLKAKQYYDYMTTKDWDLDESGSPVKSELILYLNKQDDLSDEQRAVIFSKLASGNTKNPYEDGTAHTTDWQAEYDKYLAKKNKDKDGSSNSKSSGGSKKGRSGRRSSGGGSSKTKARAKTESEKRFAALQKMKAPTTGKGIEALSQGAKGLTKAQKKALLKLMQKKLEV